MGACNDMDKINFDTTGENTADIEECDNFGCAANNNGACVMTFGECFGYIDPAPVKD
jgi:hypothetical protein